MVGEPPAAQGGGRAAAPVTAAAAAAELAAAPPEAPQLTPALGCGTPCLHSLEHLQQQQQSPSAPAAAEDEQECLLLSSELFQPVGQQQQQQPMPPPPQQQQQTQQWQDDQLLRLPEFLGELGQVDAPLEGHGWDGVQADEEGQQQEEQPQLQQQEQQLLPHQADGADGQAAASGDEEEQQRQQQQQEEDNGEQQLPPSFPPPPPPQQQQQQQHQVEEGGEQPMPPPAQQQQQVGEAATVVQAAERAQEPAPQQPAAEKLQKQAVEEADLPAAERAQEQVQQQPAGAEDQQLAGGQGPPPPPPPPQQQRQQARTSTEDSGSEGEDGAEDMDGCSDEEEEVNFDTEEEEEEEPEQDRGQQRQLLRIRTAGAAAAAPAAAAAAGPAASADPPEWLGMHRDAAGRWCASFGLALDAEGRLLQRAAEGQAAVVRGAGGKARPARLRSRNHTVEGLGSAAEAAVARDLLLLWRRGGDASSAGNSFSGHLARFNCDLARLAEEQDVMEGVRGCVTWNDLRAYVAAMSAEGQLARLAGAMLHADGPPPPWRTHMPTGRLPGRAAGGQVWQQQQQQTQQMPGREQQEQQEQQGQQGQQQRRQRLRGVQGIRGVSWKQGWWIATLYLPLNAAGELNAAGYAAKKQIRVGGFSSQPEAAAARDLALCWRQHGTGKALEDAWEGTILPPARLRREAGLLARLHACKNFEALKKFLKSLHSSGELSRLGCLLAPATHHLLHSAAPAAVAQAAGGSQGSLPPRGAAAAAAAARAPVPVAPASAAAAAAVAAGFMQGGAGIAAPQLPGGVVSAAAAAGAGGRSSVRFQLTLKAAVDANGQPSGSAQVEQHNLGTFASPGERSVARSLASIWLEGNAQPAGSLQRPQAPSSLRQEGALMSRLCACARLAALKALLRSLETSGELRRLASATLSLPGPRAAAGATAAAGTAQPAASATAQAAPAAAPALARERPYVCTHLGCGKRFAQRSTLAYHRCTHFREHQCACCSGLGATAAPGPTPASAAATSADAYLAGLEAGGHLSIRGVDQLNRKWRARLYVPLDEQDKPSQSAPSMLRALHDLGSRAAAAAGRDLATAWRHLTLGASLADAPDKFIFPVEGLQEQQVLLSQVNACCKFDDLRSLVLSLRDSGELEMLAHALAPPAAPASRARPQQQLPGRGGGKRRRASTAGSGKRQRRAPKRSAAAAEAAREAWCDAGEEECESGGEEEEDEEEEQGGPRQRQYVAGSARHDGRAAEGQRLRVCITVDGRHQQCEGMVMEITPSGLHHLLYDDGEEGLLDLGQTQYELTTETRTAAEQAAAAAAAAGLPAGAAADVGQKLEVWWPDEEDSGDWYSCRITHVLRNGMYCVRYDCDGSELLLDPMDPQQRLQWASQSRQRQHERAVEDCRRQQEQQLREHRRRQRAAAAAVEEEVKEGQAVDTSCPHSSAPEPAVRRRHVAPEQQQQQQQQAVAASAKCKALAQALPLMPVGKRPKALAAAAEAGSAATARSTPDGPTPGVAAAPVLAAGGAAAAAAGSLPPPQEPAQGAGEQEEEEEEEDVEELVDLLLRATDDPGAVALGLTGQLVGDFMSDVDSLEQPERSSKVRHMCRLLKSRQYKEVAAVIQATVG